jgi:hypothetical protein
MFQAESEHGSLPAAEPEREGHPGGGALHPLHPGLRDHSPLLEPGPRVLHQLQVQSTVRFFQFVHR